MGWKEKIRAQHKQIEDKRAKLASISVAAQDAYGFWSRAMTNGTNRLNRAGVAYERLYHGKMLLREWFAVCPWRWVRKLVRHFVGHTLKIDEDLKIMVRNYDKARIEKILGGYGEKSLAQIAHTLDLPESRVVDLMGELSKEFGGRVDTEHGEKEAAPEPYLRGRGT